MSDDNSSPLEPSNVSPADDGGGSPNPTRNQNVEREQMADEGAPDNALRPKKFDEFVGQKRVTDNLKVMVESARIREDVLDHVLLCGPPGLGKTTLAHILANEMGVNIHVTSGPALEKTGDLAGILNDLQEGDMLFIDECHRLDRLIEENLYPAIEDYYIDVVIGEGPTARSMKLPLEKFTLVGATTRAGLVTAPLRSRFGMITRLDLYAADELEKVVERSASILEIDITTDGAAEIAGRSRGTPRIANRLLRRVRDYATVEGVDEVGSDLADFALQQVGVDSVGLDSVDRLYLETLCAKFKGGPTGLKTLASAMGEERDTIELVIEPFLLQQGFIDRTTQGRRATELAFNHMEIPLPSNDSQNNLL